MKIARLHHEAQFFNLAANRARYSDPGQLMKEIELVLSVIAQAGTENQSDMKQWFAAASQSLALSELALQTKDRIKTSDLDLAVSRLEQLRPLAKSQFLKACAAGIKRDQKVSELEVELLRAFANVLNCPMPPVLPAA